MQQRAYLNNTSKEDLELIKNEIQNLNDYYTKSFPAIAIVVPSLFT